MNTRTTIARNGVILEECGQQDAKEMNKEGIEEENKIVELESDKEDNDGDEFL